MSQKVRKAVIAAAGFGTRFLPQTKALPKEMLPLVDKPIIQYIVEELVDAGIEDIVIVTGYHKRAIEDHFDNLSSDLITNLKQNGKHDLLNKTSKISELANFAYIRQKGPYGNATPVLNAAHLIGDEPFIYTYADDFILAKPSRFRQMIALYEKHEACILPCIKIEQDEDYLRYGIVGGKKINDELIALKTIIEKPGKAAAPSNLASVSGYLLTPDIFSYIDDPSKHRNGEFMIQTVMQKMINDGHTMLACEIKNGHFYDTGNKLEYIKTVIDFALKHQEIKDEFRDFLSKRSKM